MQTSAISTNSFSRTSFVNFAAILLAIWAAAVMWRESVVRPVDQGLEDHPWEVLHDIWTPEEMSRLQLMVENITTYHTVKEDATARSAHIGELVLADENNRCPHPYLVPRFWGNETVCILPERIDVASHHLRTGGITGRKELYEDLVPRMMPFQRIYHNAHAEISMDTPEIQSLFHSAKYEESAARVCKGRTFYDPIQFGIIMMVPGQEVAMHYDVPWFKGATRYDFPQWLLVVMERSGLWADRLVPQVQGVAYIQRKDAVGGEFFFYPNGISNGQKSNPANVNTGLVLDGSIVAHGVRPFMGQDATPPPMDIRSEYTILFDEEKQVWEVIENGKVLRQYNADEVRTTLVWRMRCFESEEERQSWREAETLQLDDVLDTLVADMKRRGRLVPGSSRPEPLDLALMLLEEYVEYPHGNEAVFPLNYCMLAKTLPEPLASIPRAMCAK